MTTGSAWSDAANLLCVRLDSLGDVLMTTPAIRALKESRPDGRVTLLTSPAGAAVARLVPELDDVIVYESPWMKATAPRASSAPDLEMIDLLRRARFDAAVIFTVYSQNSFPAAMLCYLADIPLRLAYCRENPYQLLTDWVKEREPEEYLRHEVRRQLDLVETVGCRASDERLSLRVSAQAEARMLAELERIGVAGSRPWLVLHPGASAPSRRYPPDSYARVASTLALDDRFQVVFTGNRQEQELVAGIRRDMDAPSWSLVDALNLEEFGALLARAHLLISNNTGPVHMAAALGTPVVDLYALTNPQHTPWLVPNRVLYHDVPCKFCYKSVCPQGHQNCLRLVEPAEVVAAARELLNETRSYGEEPGIPGAAGQTRAEVSWQRSIF